MPSPFKTSILECIREKPQNGTLVQPHLLGRKKKKKSIACPLSNKETLSLLEKVCDESCLACVGLPRRHSFSVRTQVACSHSLSIAHLKSGTMALGWGVRTGWSGGVKNASPWSTCGFTFTPLLSSSHPWRDWCVVSLHRSHPSNGNNVQIMYNNRTPMASLWRLKVHT